MNESNDKQYPDKGTPEYHVIMLKKLHRWLSQNPKNNPIVTEEVAAIGWVLNTVLPEREKDAK